MYRTGTDMVKFCSRFVIFRSDKYVVYGLHCILCTTNILKISLCLLMLTVYGQYYTNEERGRRKWERGKGGGGISSDYGGADNSI